MNISDMGFAPGRIVEAIVTTYNADKSPNAAPIGIHSISDDEISMNIHTKSDTFKNLVPQADYQALQLADPLLQHLF